MFSGVNEHLRDPEFKLEDICNINWDKTIGCSTQDYDGELVKKCHWVWMPVTISVPTALSQTTLRPQAGPWNYVVMISITEFGYQSL